MYVPDIAVGRPLPRVSEKTGKPLKPTQWVWHRCRSCGEITAVPLGIKGMLSSNLGRDPFCGGKR